ncbi:hypothetical protein ACFQVC_18985 [Streptomyces monticola]|uniref:WXG100 family type VII secretion target n=1 Tax=Streptomyces monticola TaxID=2666263 RepID=A0ABW2JLS4_9ACTN
MSSGDGFRADTDAMAQITKGINLAMDELKELGFDVEANLGRGFDELELAGLEVGDKGLQETFGDFCERWGWGIRTLMQNANKFAVGLDLSAGMYHEQEQYLGNTFKGVLNQVGGNPYATEEEIRDQSYTDAIVGATPYGHIKDADYSAESIVEGQRQADEAWSQVGQDFQSSPWTPWQDNTEWQWDGPPGAEAAPEGTPEEDATLIEGER